MAAPMDEDADLVDTDDYYAWLGLGKEASVDEINNAFRKLSRIYHPDKHAANPEKNDKAQNLFTRIKKAHEVLSDPQKKAIYDTMGVKGLETEGWEIVPRQKTPQEILEEYERLAREREERRLNQRTNPKGNIRVNVDATDVFESYGLDVDDYRAGNLPQLEVSRMGISQSVELPLTSSDTCVLSGELSTQNGNGTGTLRCCYRRVVSHRGWAEGEVSLGSGLGFTLRGFRTLWKRGFCTMSGSLQSAPRGLKPSFNIVVAHQLDKNIQGRMVWNPLRPSSLQTMAVWDSDRHHLVCALQLGVLSSFGMMNYTFKYTEHDAKLKGSVQIGTFGMFFEYGCEKKVSQFSVLGGSVMIGTTSGVTVKIKMNRGSQSYIFPVHLSDSILPSAIFYGTVLPLAGYFLIKVLIINPFNKQQREKELKQKREANASRLKQKKQDAQTAIELMRETVARSYEIEDKKGGLVIKKALYGKLKGGSSESLETIVVTQPLQALVQDSRLHFPEGTQLSELPGFYDPCIGEDKELLVIYDFRRKPHRHVFVEPEKILIPHKEHLDTSSTSSTSTADASTSSGNSL